jgi:hypothetical protein
MTMPTISIPGAFLVNELFRDLKFAWNKAVSSLSGSSGELDLPLIGA